MSLSIGQLSAMHREFQKLAVVKEAPTSVAEEGAQQEQPQPEPEKKPLHPALTAAKYLGAYGAGTLAGYGGMYGIQKLRGKPFNPQGLAVHAIPALAGFGSLAFAHAQNSLFDRMKEDALKRRGNGG